MSLIPQTKKEFFTLVFLIILTTTLLTISNNTTLDSLVLNTIDNPNYLYPLAPGLPILVSLLDWKHCAQTGQCLDSNFILFATFLLNLIFIVLILSGIARLIFKKNLLTSVVRVTGCLFLVNMGVLFSFASGWQSTYFVRTFGLILLGIVLYYKVTHSQKLVSETK